MALLDLQGMEPETRDHKRGNSGASKNCNNNGGPFGHVSGLSLLLCNR